jgi:hypothetical protein
LKEDIQFFEDLKIFRRFVDVTQPHFDHPSINDTIIWRRMSLLSLSVIEK